MPALIRLNDQPVMFMSGSIHYPRSTPGMWPGLMKAAAADGLNMIEIYVFWNYHEQVEGTFDWSERGNLTLFLDAIKEAGLFANLRIGPYVCAEWDYGGIPVMAGVQAQHATCARTISPGCDAVQAWMQRVIDETRDYFADRGGPIVMAQVLHPSPHPLSAPSRTLSAYRRSLCHSRDVAVSLPAAQVENELHGCLGEQYLDWCGDMANAFAVNVPWLMCNGQSANNTINTCNGNDCVSASSDSQRPIRPHPHRPARHVDGERGLVPELGRPHLSRYRTGQRPNA